MLLAGGGLRSLGHEHSTGLDPGSLWACGDLSQNQLECVGVFAAAVSLGELVHVAPQADPGHAVESTQHEGFGVRDQMVDHR